MITTLTVVLAATSFAASTIQTLESSLISSGSFLAPTTGVKWRYWVEDGSASPDILRYDISEIARVGSSGFELLSYQSYGGRSPNTGNILLSPADYAFGSDAFTNVTSVLIDAAKSNNLTIDFTMGPNQGAGVPVFPSDVDQEGMNTELVFGSQFLLPSETFSGPLPSPTTFPTVSSIDGGIVSANTTQETLVSVVVAELLAGADTSAAVVSLDWNTVQDVTSLVDQNNISFTAPNSSSVLLAYYYHRNGYPEAIGGFGDPSLEQPGSWGSFVVDHFSAKGANISASFIEQNIFSRDDIASTIAEPGVGSYVWEDSMEFYAQVFWTDDLPSRFLTRHGYEINKTLPVLHNTLRSISFSTSTFPNQTFNFGTTIDWEKFIDDFCDTLTSLYVDHMSALNDWAHSVGLHFSNQPGYNFYLDLGASAAIPDTPEIESLGVPTIDEARQLSGGVHLGNHNIFSSETGARPNEAFSLRMVELLTDARTQFAATVNLLMLHGFPYTGAYPGTTWPGITTFGFDFADMHGPRMPAWNHYIDYLDFLKRNQYVLQSGVAKVDAAIYRKEYNLISTPLFQSTSLIEAGYTYDYVSPENFKLPGVNVSNNRLALDGPAYKAFILDNAQNITVDAAQSLLRFASAGLPIIVSGTLPDDIPGFDFNGTQKTEVETIISQLTTQFANVLVVDSEDDVPGALNSLGALPSVSADPPSASLYSVRRDVTPSLSYFYLFNEGESTINFTLSLDPGFAGTPFVLNPWDGSISPVVLYTNDSGVISIPSVSLASTQTALFAVTDGSALEDIAPPVTHLVNLTSNTAVTVVNGSFIIQSSVEGIKEYTTSDGQQGSVNVSLGGETVRTLDGWVLQITAWTPPQNLSEVDSILVEGSVFNLTDGLVPWSELEGQTNTSGVGIYNTTFEWNHNASSGVGATLDFGEVFHTVRAFINDVQITTADPTAPVVDVSKYLSEGINLIRVEAASTLLNALNAVPEVETLGFLRTQTSSIPANQAYGLIAPVQLIPYGFATINQ